MLSLLTPILVDVLQTSDTASASGELSTDPQSMSFIEAAREMEREQAKLKEYLALNDDILARVSLRVRMLI